MGAVKKRQKQIGIDRLIRLEWLQQTADLVLAGSDKETIKTFLQDHIRSHFLSRNDSVRGSIDKTITILMRTWVHPPDELGSFQRDGLKLLQVTPREERIAIHWGMIMAVYPFWGNVAAQVGRILGLQGDVTAAQVQRRLKEQYGERETVSRRTRYVLRSFIEWEVLKETSKQGVYSQGSLHSIGQPMLVAWLAEALLHSKSDNIAPLDSVLISTSFFPFKLARITSGELTSLDERLEIIRHGMDQELLRLR
jgi:hypothetical protein